MFDTIAAFFRWHYDGFRCRWHAYYCGDILFKTGGERPGVLRWECTCGTVLGRSSFGSAEPALCPSKSRSVLGL
jgi:hypothetical protein